MSRFINERLKTICIFVLIITGLLQVGILWGYQSQGTPTSFLLRFFNGAAQIDDTVARERLFVPDRLILSNGGLDHWNIDRNSDIYNDLWDEAKLYLYGIASGTVNLKESNEDWGELVEKRGFIIDFGYTMEPGLLKWFLKVGEKVQELPAVYKIMVKPDIVDENTSIIYIYSTGGKVYISDLISNDRERSLGDIITAVSDNGRQEYRNYYTFRGGKIDKTMDAEPDVLYVSGAPRYWPYFEYSSNPPARAEKKDDLETIVLGNEKDRYNKSNINENTIQYNYGSNIYRYYADGYLTYQYLGSADSSGKREIGEALLNAYKFVDRINQLSETTADIVLASVEEKQQGIFSFSFDYRLKGMPVKFELDMKDGNGKLTHAINIQADSKRVLKCDWALRDFAQGAKGSYNDRFVDMDLVRFTGKEVEEMNIRDMRSGYFINSVSDSVLKPMLLIEMKDKLTFQIEMPSKKGD